MKRAHRTGWHRQARRALAAACTLLAVSLLAGCRGGPAGSVWRSLSPLPDPVGFGGMFAGVSGKSMFAGGGSRFLDKPAWAGGTKVFSDQVFVLASPHGLWRELPHRLPNPLAHAAVVPWRDGIIVAGGMNAHGALRAVHYARLEGKELLLERLAPLPHPLVYAAAAVVGDVLYVVGGVSAPLSKRPDRRCWALALDAPKRLATWRRVADFPGKAGILMAAGSDGQSLFVFGGMHYEQGAKGRVRPEPLSAAYRYDPAVDRWRRLCEMPVARVGAAAPPVLLADGSFLLAGGYGSVFSGPPERHPGFERQTLLYSRAANRWLPGPPLPWNRGKGGNPLASPGPLPMIGAPAVVWQNRIVLISGEVRPAVRTPAVIAAPIEALGSAPKGNGF